MKNSRIGFLTAILAVFSVFAALGCSSGVRYTNLEPGTVRTVETAAPSAVVESEKVEVPVYEDKEPPLQYRAGPGDVLLVTVYGRPDFGSPIMANGQAQGSRVDGNGRIQLPMLGSIDVADNSTEEIKEKVEKLLRQYLKEPSVTVEVLSFGSKQVSLLGLFNAPGSYYLDRPTRLLQALALGKGLRDNADLKSARLVRDQKVLPVDIYALVRGGEIANNIWIRAGDTVFVPQQLGRRVYVFGAVKRPGPVDIPEDQQSLNLTQAVAFAGLSESNYEERHIRIIRSQSATKGELMVVDLKKILDGEALPFQLVENDIVFVPKGELGEWNQAISEMMPTLQAVGAFLQPFVQVRLLTSGR